MAGAPSGGEPGANSSSTSAAAAAAVMVATASHTEVPSLTDTAARELLFHREWRPMPLALRPSPTFRLLMGLPSDERARALTPAETAVAQTSLAAYLLARAKMLSDWQVGTPNTTQWADSYTPPPEPAGGVPLNLHQLGRSLVKGALAASYACVCRDLFAPLLSCEASTHTPSAASAQPSSGAESAAQRVLRGAALDAEPALFSSMLSTLIAYGVRFRPSQAAAAAAPAADAGAAGKPPTVVADRSGTQAVPKEPVATESSTDAAAAVRCAELPVCSPNDACWQIHAVVLQLSHRMEKMAQELNDTGYASQSALTRCFLRVVLNLHSMLSFLNLFVRAARQSEEGTPSCTTGKPYTEQDFNELQRSSPSEPHAQDSSLRSSLPHVCQRLLFAAVDIFSSVGCRWTLVNSAENTEQVRSMLALYPGAVADALRVLRLLCRDFPVLKLAVLRRDGDGGDAAGTFRLEQLLDSSALELPPKSASTAALGRPYEATALATAAGRRRARLALTSPTALQPPKIGGAGLSPIPPAVAELVYVRDDVDQEEMPASHDESDTAPHGRDTPDRKKRRVAEKERWVHALRQRLLHQYGAVKRRAVAGGAGNRSGDLPPPCTLATEPPAATGAGPCTQTSPSAVSFGDVFDDAPAEDVAAEQSALEGFVGLQNMGNTCFLNSVTQLLFRSSAFAVELIERTMEDIAEHRLSLSVETEEGQTMNENKSSPPSLSVAAAPTSHSTAGPSAVGTKVKLSLMLLLLEMRWRVTHHYSAVSVSPQYVTAGLPPPFDDHRQHDVSEYSKFLLEHLDTEERRAGAGDASASASASASPPALLSLLHGGGSTIVSRWFGGSVVTDMKCLSCGRVRSHVNPFWDCSLPLRCSPAAVDASPGTAPPSPRTVVHDGSAAALITAVTTYTRSDSSNSVAVERSNSSPRESFGSCRSRGDDESTPDNAHGQSAVTNEAGGPGLGSSSPEAARAHPSSADEPRGVSIQSLLNRVTDPSRNVERLDGDNRLECCGCRQRAATQLSTRIVALRADGATAAADGLPHYLTLQLNRFQYNRQSSNYEKLLDPVCLDEVVSLPVWYASSSAATPTGDALDAAGSAPLSSEEEEAVDAAVTARLSLFSEEGRVFFRLKAFIVHSGSTPMSGHYFTIAKAQQACLPADMRAQEAQEVRSFVDSQCRPTRLQHVRAASCTDGPTCASPVDAPADLQPLSVTSSFYRNWVMLNDSNVRRLKVDAMRGILSGRCGVHSHLETPYLVMYERVDGPGSEELTAAAPQSYSQRLPVELPPGVEQHFRARVESAAANPVGARSDSAANRWGGSGGGGDGSGPGTDFYGMPRAGGGWTPGSYIPP